jgi:hypothetical protein
MSTAFAGIAGGRAAMIKTGRTLAALVLSAVVGPSAAGAALPDHAEVLLTLDGAVWRPEKPDEKKPVVLRLQRVDGAWGPSVVGETPKSNNATHGGFVTRSRSGPDGETLQIRLHIQPDPWSGGEAEAAYTLRLRVDGTRCTGTWSGVVHGGRAEGTLNGLLEPVTPVPGFKPPAPGERPRLLIRRDDLPRLRARAQTPWGRDLLAQLREDRGSPAAQAFVYALTGDAACAEAAKARLVKALDHHEWYHIGIAHAPAFLAVEHLIAYDLLYETFDEAFHRRLREHLADKLHFYYWGAQNTQFNPSDTSNWSLMYRSGLGLVALSLLDAPPAAVAPPTPPTPLAKLAPPADLKVGDGVPVVALDPEKPIGAWLFAGPVDEGPHDDAFRDSGGIAAARPAIGTKAGDCTFRPIAEPDLRDGNVNLASLTKRAYRRACYLYCVIEVPEAGHYKLESVTRQPKGVRYRALYLNGVPLKPGDHVHLGAGRYPALARIWTEPVGNWEPLPFWARLARSSEAEAAAWHAVKSGAVAADPACGASWREDLQRRVPWNLEALRWLSLAAHKAEKYCLRSLGDHGWNQEGEAYTRHAVHLAMPLALCYRNTFGRDIRGADRLGMMLALCTAATVFSDAGARMQSYNVGGGPMDLDLYARGFAFVPPPLRPAVLWSWNRTDALAKAGKLADPHGVIAHYDGLTKIMLFLTPPQEFAERNPEEILPRVVADKQKGGYIFRNRWKDGDDCVVSVFANSNQAGGSWVSAEGGTFRIDGLGEAWAIRGQGYGNGASGRELQDYCLYQNMVDVKEHVIDGSPQAWTTQFTPEKDGSGVVSLTMDEIYIHHEKSKVEGSSGKRRSVEWKPLGAKDLGIRALRSVAVDYSGAGGAPCLVVVADRLTGTQGDNTWQMSTERGHAVTCSGNGFLIQAKSGATLRGTVVRPAGAAVRAVEAEHVHEINYRGSHSRKPFQQRVILMDGKDKDQDFLVVMTLQKSEPPAVRIDGEKARARAVLGKRTIDFDGRRVILE